MTGLYIVKDYGVHWDEFNSHHFGVHWYKYAWNVIVNGGPLIPQEQETIHDKTHGPAFEMALAFIADKIFHLEDSRDIIILRHCGIWLLFYISVIFFYFLCKLHFKEKKLALLGCLLLVLHPRIFAHSFYDSVDISFLSLYIISLYTLVHYLKTKSLTMIILHAFACAILIDIRIIGVIVPMFSYTLLLWGLAKVRYNNRHELMKSILHIFIYTIALAGFTILFWPYLWRNPVSALIVIIKLTPHIGYGDTVLYFGEFIKATQIPWHYIPVWIGITTPVLYIFFFMTGLFVILKKLIARASGPDDKLKNGLLSLAAFFLPLFLVIVFKSTLYDSWRHLFFIYPAFVLIALSGVEGCDGFMTQYRHRHRTIYFVSRVIFIGLILISFSCTGIFMIKYHPYQNVYFNRLAGNDMTKIKNNFELDYWGLSYRKALEYITANDGSESIKVYDAITMGPMQNNIPILPIRERKRICQVWTPDEATYLLTNYRWHKQDYPYPNEFFSINVKHAKIMTVFKLNP